MEMEVLIQVITIYLILVIFSNVYILHAVSNHIIARNFNSYNAIYHHNKMWKYELSLDKYWVTQSDYFRHETAVVLGVDIIDSNTILCHCISE